MKLTKYHKIISANWKMNGTFALVDEFHQYLSKNYTKLYDPNILIIICPPFPFLNFFKSKISKFPNIFIGSQDCSASDNLSMTGDVSVEIIKDAGCDFVILGHSERRNNYNETNLIIANKLRKVLKNNLKAVVCIGETEVEKNGLKTFDILTSQINNSLIDSCNPNNTIIAYEPIWAIGSGILPTLEEIKQVIEHIHGTLKIRFNSYHENNFRILYGGSVKPSNSSEILFSNFIDGVLVGGSSLSINDLGKIINFKNN